MRTLVLCYHSQRIVGNDYSLNDHVALASDLAAVARRRIPLISFTTLLDYLDGRQGPYPSVAVVLTCDDGALLDWYDYEHPEFGFQLSFDQILLAHLREARPHQSIKGLISSFIIASPEARQLIDQVCYAGIRLTTEDWWQPAAASGRWLFGNHSWDHRHLALSAAGFADGDLGHFHGIINRERSEEQVMQAEQYLTKKIKPHARLPVFAYPYGHSTAYLSEEYLPGLRHHHGIRAAVTTTPGLVVEDTDRYLIPRYTCGEHWHTADEFEQLLDLLESRL